MKCMSCMPGATRVNWPPASRLLLSRDCWRISSRSAEHDSGGCESFVWATFQGERRRCGVPATSRSGRLPHLRSGGACSATSARESSKVAVGRTERQSVLDGESRQMHVRHHAAGHPVAGDKRFKDFRVCGTRRRSLLSNTSTGGSRRLAAWRFATVRGKRVTSFSSGTSCPPCVTRIATRSSDIAGLAKPIWHNTPLAAFRAGD